MRLYNWPSQGAMRFLAQFSKKH